MPAMASQQEGITNGKLPSLGAGLHFMRKSASHEPLGPDASPSSDSGCGVGIKQSSASAHLSPTPNSRKHQRQTASEDGVHQPVDPASFLVGSAVEDDVFAETPAENAMVLSSPNKDAQLRVNPASIDAQGIYPGTACMFVANLSQPYDDNTLELEVTKAFSQFGEVWVKIKRDGSQMPFAFCQFAKDEHAQNAVKFGKGMIILGRPCRTEMARAHSSFIVFKKSGYSISLAEASDLLGQLGEVAKAEFIQEDIQTALNLPEAVLVTYKMYDNRRDPVKYFAQSQKFHVMSNDPKRIPDANTMSTLGPAWNGGPDLMEQYDKDRRSAFIGNLPLSMTEDLLRTMASPCGEVVQVQLYKKLIPGGNGLKHCFGFVEFIRPDSADDLVTSLHSSDIEGHRVRVERKHSRTFATPQRPSGQLRHVRSTIPRRRLLGDSEMTSSDQVEVTSPTGSFRISGHALTCNPKAFTCGRGRRPRATIFGPDTSLAKASSSGNLRHALDKASPAVLMENSRSPLNKNSVEFQVPEEKLVSQNASQSAVVEPEAQPGDPSTPNQNQEDTAALKHREASHTPVDANAGFAQPPQVAWMPTYSHYGYPYMSAPMTPQGAPGLMYGGYMAPPYYGAMYDMFGNLMVSPPPMMSPYHASHTPNDAAHHADENRSPQGSNSHNVSE